MICRLVVLALSGAILGPILWHYVTSHEPVVSEGTRKRLIHEQASEDLIREQEEMPKGRQEQSPEGGAASSKAFTRPVKP